ncbi:MAG: toprim domain-containing protein [Bryobacteraceae bacterium]
MRIGYAPGACLRAHLEDAGYARTEIEQSGLLNARGCDRFYRCLRFPLDGNANLYGRGLDRADRRHHFLPWPKGGLYGWNQVRVGCSVIVVVEGLFDLASLWQAGFDNAVALLGALPNAVQLAQLCQAPPRSVYVCLDADRAGRNPAHRLAAQLRRAGVYAGRVELPDGHDPNSFFAAGATVSDFQHCLERGRAF